MDNRPWIGVDLDGTLAHYEGWKGKDHIGDPIPSMLTRVYRWIEEGKRVKIFTARACIPEQIEPVAMWLDDHGLTDLEITCSKDLLMLELWDDRCVQVISNQGVPIQGLLHPAIQHRVKSAREEHHTDTVDPTPIDMGGGWQKVGSSLVNRKYNIELLIGHFHVQMDSHNAIGTLLYLGPNHAVKHIVTTNPFSMPLHGNDDIKIELLKRVCCLLGEVLDNENA